MGEKAFIFVQDKTSEHSYLTKHLFLPIFGIMLKKYEETAQLNVLQPTL